MISHKRPFDKIRGDPTLTNGITLRTDEVCCNISKQSPPMQRSWESDRAPTSFSLQPQLQLANQSKRKMCTQRKHEKQQNSNTGKGGIECAKYTCTLSKKVGAFFSNLTINLMSFTVDKYATHTHTHTQKNHFNWTFLSS